MAEPVVIEGFAPVHMIGIGGAGMSALAKILLARDLPVTGSDIKESPALAGLRALGARIAIGHDAANLAEPGSVVVSTAIREHNPELVAARTRGVPVLHRAQLLALLMRGRRGIAVSGTHGKTTTTSMIASILQRAGLDPGFVIGGDLNERGTNAHDGAGAWFVAEADESDASLLWLAPQIAVVTNIEADHLDHYRDEAEIRATFLAFLDGVEPDGLVVLGAEDPGARAVAASITRRTVTVGLAEGDWRAEKTGTSGWREVDVFRRNERLGSMRLGIPGAHNVRNALAALAVADAVGVPFDDAAETLAVYQGVQRRLQRRGTAAQVDLLDDYAHHPTEVRATLDAVREGAPGRVIAVFQPHLYSRTRFFASGLGAALAAADQVVVTDVYGAREEPEPGVTGKLVVDGVLAASPRARVAYLPRRGDVPAFVVSRARPGDTIVTIGAGDVTMLGDEILRLLQERAT